MEALRPIFLIEFKDVLGSRWFIFYILVFLLLSLGFLWAGSGEAQIAGYSGIGRFMASVVNISFLLIPIFSLIPASSSISGARENLSLEYMLAFPVKKSVIFFSKFISVVAVVFSAPLISLLISLFFLGVEQGEIMIFFKIVVFIFLLSLAFVSLGFFVSALSSSRGKATSVSLFLWFLFTIGSELGILGFIAVSRIPTPAFFPIIFLNPAETFRVACISLFSKSLDILGPFGIYIYNKLGNYFLLVSALSILAFSFVFIVLSFLVFRKKRV